MAIYIITGIPGSGKSYYAVWHIWKNYLYYDAESENIGWKIKKGYQIISNIEEFDKNVPQVRNINKIIEFYKINIEKFFTMDIQKKITDSDGCLITHENDDENLPEKDGEEKWKIIYLLDEAQNFFGSRYTLDHKDTENDTSFYFQRHRKLGHTLYIITQDIKLLWTKIWRVAASEIRAAPKHIKIPGTMAYNFRIPGTLTIEKSKNFKLEKEVFSLYRSMENEESEGFKRSGKQFLFVACVVMFFLTIGFIIYKGGNFFNIFNKKNVADNHIYKPAKQTTKNTQNAQMKSGKKEKNDEKDKKEKFKQVKLNHVIKYSKEGEVISIKVFDMEDGVFKDISNYQRKYRILLDDRKNPTIIAAIPAEAVAEYESVYPKFYEGGEKFGRNIYMKTQEIVNDDEVTN